MATATDIPGPPRQPWLLFVTVTAAFALAFVVATRVLGVRLTAPWFVLTAMICFLGWVSTARPLFLPTLPRGLRTVRAWEGPRGLYRVLGVTVFGALLRRTPLRVLNVDVYLSRSPREPAVLAAQLEAAEAAHLWDAVLVAPYMVYAASQHWWVVLLWFVVAQVLANIYPILHLRMVRGRLQRTLNRATARPRSR